MILLNVSSANAHSPTFNFSSHYHDIPSSPTYIQDILSKVLGPSTATKRKRGRSISDDSSPTGKRQKPSIPARRPSEPGRVDYMRDINWYGFSKRRASIPLDAGGDCATSDSDDPDDLDDDEPDGEEEDEKEEGTCIDDDAELIARWLRTHGRHQVRGRLVYVLNERTGRIDTRFRFDADAEGDEPIEVADHPVWSSALFYNSVGVREDFTGDDPDGDWVVFLHEPSVSRRLKVAMVMLEGMPNMRGPMDEKGD